MYDEEKHQGWSLVLFKIVSYLAQIELRVDAMWLLAPVADGYLLVHRFPSQPGVFPNMMFCERSA